MWTLRARPTSVGLPDGIRRRIMRQLVAQLLDLGHRDRRYELEEQQEQRREQPDGSDEQRDVDPRRRVVLELRRDEVLVQRGDDDVEALAPHADVDEDRRDPHDWDARARLLE